MSCFTNLTTTTNKLEENVSEDMCVSDEDDSDVGEGGSKDNSKDDFEDDSEVKPEGGEVDTNDDPEGDNSPTLLPSSASRCSRMVHFHPAPAEQFQSARKCSGVLPSSPVQPFRRLFSDDVFQSDT
jgi:hypothetical protein